MRRGIARFPLAVGLAILALTSWPYAAGYRAASPERPFLGFFENASDANPYVSWIRQASEGRVFLESLYSPEAVPPHLFNLMTFVLGNVSRVTTLSPIGAYQTGRIAFGALLLAVLWWSTGIFLSNRPARRLAFAWMSAGAGMGWVFVLLHGRALLDPPRPLDLRIPEAFTFYSILTFPHLALSMALLVITLVSTFLAMTRRRLRPALVAAGACLLLGGFHPYPLLTVVGTVLLHAALSAARRDLDRSALAMASIVLVAAAAGLAWNVFMFSRDPVLIAWKAQNVTPSLHPLQYLLGLGPALWLGTWAAFHLIRQQRAGSAPEAGGAPLFLVSWIVATLVLIYAPFAFQRRMIEGIEVPLVLLAAMGLWSWGERAARRGWMLALSGLAVALSLPSSFLLMSRSMDRARSLSPEWHTTRDELDAIAWLGGHAAHDSVVLASMETGNRIPRFVDCRVFLGHNCQTRQVARRTQQARIFFEVPVPEAERQQFLRAEGIEWLVYGPAERRGAVFDPAASWLFEEAHREGDIVIYRVKR